MNDPYTYVPQNCNSQQPLLSQTNSDDSSARWKVLLWACLSTFGVYYTNGLISCAIYPLMQAFDVNLLTYTEAMNKVLGFACVIPLISGILIYHFGVNRAYRFFILLLAVGRSLTFSSFRTQTWTLFVAGESCFFAANYGLWVAQIYMIIKWFKGKELSLAIGIIGLSNNTAFRVATFLYSYVNAIALTNLLLLGVILCILATIAVFFLNKTDLAVKREDDREEKSTTLFDDLGRIKKTAIILSLIIIFFSVGDYSSQVMYMDEMIARFLTNSNATFEIINGFDVYISFFMFPLFGLLADWKKKRIATMFAAIVMFFIGNTAFFLFHQSTYLIFIYLAFVLFRLGSCLFQVSAFACLGDTVNTRILGLILGFVYSLLTFANWLEDYIYVEKKLLTTTICFIATVTLMLGLGLAIYCWKVHSRHEKVEPRVAEKDVSHAQIRVN